jgi:hypothetical protein
MRRRSGVVYLWLKLYELCSGCLAYALLDLLNLNLLMYTLGRLTHETFGLAQLTYSSSMVVVGNRTVKEANGKLEKTKDEWPNKCGVKARQSARLVIKPQY